MRCIALGRSMLILFVGLLGTARSRLLAQGDSSPSYHGAAAPESEEMSIQEMVPGSRSHMTFTPLRAGTAGDTARALTVVRALRAAIAPYQDLAAAEAAGYRARQPEAKQRKRGLLHVGRPRRGGRAAAPFDPAAPQALLYRRDGSGEFRLAGAMFSAPRAATEDQLDAWIPLGVARWHRHVNVCRGPRGERSPAFRRAETEEECAGLGGRFRARSRCMIHVMTEAGDDLDRVFPQG